MTPTTSARALVRRGPVLSRAVGRPSGARHGCTKSKSGQAVEKSPKSEPTTVTVQGPSWVWLEPVGRPFRAYSRAQARRPYVVQLLSTITIWFFGDLSAQMISASEEDSYSPSRALRSVFIGSLTSIPNYRWFMFLGQSFNYSSKLLSLATKIVVNQLVFTPVFNTYFFSMHSLLGGATFEELVERVRIAVPVSWVNSCKLWPAVTAFSFTFIPPQFRSIFAGFIAIGWQSWLTLLNQRAAAQEKAEHAKHQEHFNISQPAPREYA
ncbi:Protein SYM1 [Lasiodiplodia hormozganensis]|uniref:Protein SYM1 n=1 Tax=Lasiodiplodia hormozganensis TaxID=869390 RepID=A0AA40CN37_9PEZI|nr:Protein SYM1 [Lasiodiplodia hormozganensis]